MTVYVTFFLIFLLFTVITVSNYLNILFLFYITFYIRNFEDRTSYIVTEIPGSKYETIKILSNTSNADMYKNFIKTRRTQSELHSENLLDLLG